MQTPKSLKFIFKILKNNRLLSYLVKNFLVIVAKLIFKTYRLEIEVDEKLEMPMSKWNGVFYFWHQNIIAAMFFFFKQKSVGYSIVSPSNDGKIIGYVLQKLGFKVLYGSAYKKSVQLIRQGLEILDANKKICIVGDGSRGPAFQLQRGVIYLAAKSKLPLVFVECKTQSAIKITKSWDQFKIPLPFTKISIKVHQPIIPSIDAYKNFEKPNNVHISQTT
ncbi:MAG: DUF374 domain-containing protein [bacterium]